MNLPSISSWKEAYQLMICDNDTNREWPRCCPKVYWTKLDQHGPNSNFGQNALIPNRILAFARPKGSILVHFGLVFFGPFRSANRTLAIPELSNL